MGKRRFLTGFVMVACVLSVVGGHFYYNNKLEETAYAAKLEMAKDAPKEKTKTENTTAEKQTTEHFKNAPAGIADLYEQKKAAGESLQLTLVGSSLTSTDEGSWAKLFTAKMNETYGKDVTVETTSFGQLNSLELTDQQVYTDFVQKKSDVILIEPVLMNDNNGISINDTLYVLDQMIAKVKETNPEAVILLQPSNPIYQPQKYATQVSSLETYAKEQGIPFVNHWEAWPSVESEEINQYVTNLVPNEEGHKVWADYIYNVFK
ncbi:SGNH/GDSL hydrolase family protein [Fictibacillus nanhaiensis]|uniref:SGNH/GDSL hydrolase family protein n=1 Tax=Fictibacillus nanhaiensis TaxID=742169 RepID=UPI002040F39E|nr:SGNH/GDSL hydrolase family protein [Fictibacillus nanhaiensis]MCM3733460.1 SGNH/GDSL hydrolase family protein [Fictibacillus nanhaiensis]